MLCPVSPHPSPLTIVLAPLLRPLQLCELLRTLLSRDFLLISFWEKYHFTHREAMLAGTHEYGQVFTAAHGSSESSYHWFGTRLWSSERNQNNFFLSWDCGDSASRKP